MIETLRLSYLLGSAHDTYDVLEMSDTVIVSVRWTSPAMSLHSLQMARLTNGSQVQLPDGQTNDGSGSLPLVEIRKVHCSMLLSWARPYYHPRYCLSNVSRLLYAYTLEKLNEVEFYLLFLTLSDIISVPFKALPIDA